jgi:hypothetical protein
VCIFSSRRYLFSFCFSEGCSQWDQKKVKKYKTAAPQRLETVVKSCAPQTWYAIKDGKCVFLGKQPPPETKQPTSDKTKKIVPGVPFVAPNQSSLVSLDIVKSGRLSEFEIRCLPKFENYDRGLPTSVSVFIFIESSLLNNFCHYRLCFLKTLLTEWRRMI